MVARLVTVRLPVHGGDPASVVARYGAGAWIDFSANIAPDGPPASVRAALRVAASDMASIVAYPMEHDRALRTALAIACHVGEDRIVLGNGAAALIEAFVRTIRPRRALVPQPAFSEYGRALAAEGCETIPFALGAADGFALDADRLIVAMDRERPDAVILTNPHNPSGACAPRPAVAGVIAAAVDRRIALLVDEAFADYVPDASCAHDIVGDRVLVLRSLTKFYAMPALRVGYGIAAPAFSRELTARIPSWPITSVAAEAARAAVGDHMYATATRAANAEQRSALISGLRTLGLRVFESAANFVLFEAPLPSAHLADALARSHRLIVRDCSSFAGLEDGHFIRVAVRTRDENDRLVTALHDILTTAST